MININDLVVGSRVVGFSGMHGQGPEHRSGVVTEHVTDRWGSHLKVQMDDGSEDSVHSLRGTATLKGESFRISTGFGIGWYSVAGE